MYRKNLRKFVYICILVYIVHEEGAIGIVVAMHHCVATDVMSDEIIAMRVSGISQLTEGVYVLLLAEADGLRRVPVVVGLAEAQSIAVSLEGKTPKRPLTHDLLVKVCGVLGGVLQEVYIHHFENGTFYSQLTLCRGEERLVLDSRTSDAVAIALRANVPVYMSREVLRITGIDIADSSRQENYRYEAMSNDALQARIDEAVAAENYEEAALIQQILAKRK